MARGREQGRCDLLVQRLLRGVAQVPALASLNRRFAKALLKVGMQPHDVCAMIGFNSPEYYFSLQGTWLSGGVTAGIYTTNSAEACAYVLKHSEAKVCVCQSGKSAMKIASICDSLPQLKAIVVYWPDEDMPVLEDCEGVCASCWREF